MGLHQTILDDLTTAMKAQDSDRVAVLRMLKAALLNVSKSAGGSDMLEDEEVLSVLKKEVKKRKESIAAFTDGGRPELAENEAAEMALLETYLPEEMSEAEVRAIIEGIVQGQESPQFGAVMGQAMQAVAGNADGNLVRQIVEAVIADNAESSG